jgi:hypothetical protein
MPVTVELRLRDGSTDGLDRKASYIEIDRRLCEALNEPCDALRFYKSWADWLPLLLASQDKHPIRVDEMEELKPMLVWFIDNVDCDAYYSPR